MGVYQNRDKYLARALQVAARMENLIQEILEISRMERSQAGGEWERVDLSELTAQQVRLDLELLEQRGLHLETQLTPGLWVMGERNLLAKVLDNLLSNAPTTPQRARASVSGPECVETGLH